jgi:protocatechuate 3,4-dioxygenase beta subunit
MARRFSLLCAVLVMGMLAAWLLRARGAERTRAVEEETVRAQDAGAPAALEPPADVIPPARQREPVVVATARAKVEEGDEAKPVETDATLVVRTIDESEGTPLPRVRVWVKPERGGSSRHVEGAKGTLQTSPLTDTDGRAEFELPAGIPLRVSAWGEDEEVGRANTEIQALEPGERRELTLEVPTGNDLHFFLRVLAREDKVPITGASVELLRRKTQITGRVGERMQLKSNEITLAEGVTDSNGLFDLWLPSWKEPDVCVRASGFGEVLVHVGSEHNSPESARVVLLSRAASLRARVLDAGGAPVACGGVRLWTEGYHLVESDHGEIHLPSVSQREWIQDADASGLCALEGLPPDVPFHVEVLRARRAVKKDLPSLSLHAGEVREVEWRLGSGCRLEGTVVDQAGEAVREQKLWLQRADRDAPKVFELFHSGEVVVETQTDSEGRFAFADVSPGSWWLGPAAERMDRDAPDPEAVAPMAEVVEIPEGLLRREILLRVHRGLYIRGQVLDPAGAPSPDTYVMGYTEAGAWGLSARSGSDGEFAVGPLVPGRYWLNARGWTHANSEPIEANAGDDGVILRLRAGGGLSGTIRDGATGAGCAGQLTVASCDSPEGWQMREAEKDGAFRFDGLTPGTYCIAARASGRRVGLLRNVSVLAGGELGDLVVTLVPGAGVRIKYAGKDGYIHYRIISDGVTVAGDGVPAGGSSDTAAPAGRLVIECMRIGLDQETTVETKEIDLAVGEEKELVFGDAD